MREREYTSCLTDYFIWQCFRSYRKKKYKYTSLRKTKVTKLIALYYPVNVNIIAIALVLLYQNVSERVFLGNWPVCPILISNACLRRAISYSCKLWYKQSELGEDIVLCDLRASEFANKSYKSLDITGHTFDSCRNYFLNPTHKLLLGRCYFTTCVRSRFLYTFARWHC